MRRIWMILLLALTLAGCKTIADIKPDTIVDIPLHPTELQTQPATEMTTAPTEAAAETEVPTETEPTAEPTEAATQPPRSNSSSSGGKKPGKGNSNSRPAATQQPTEAPTDPASYDPAGYVPGSLDRAVAEDLNTRRQAEGLAALTLDTRLSAIASVRARETASTWGHNRPDGSAGIAALEQYGYSYGVAAENIYFGTGSAASIVDKWMSSESRRANILMEDAKTVGVGSYTSSDGLTFVAVFFVG